MNRSAGGIRLAGVALLAATFLGLFLGYRTLWMPDEGRYAEIAREMLESGDWATPRLDYVRYFEKPPLIYWASATSMALFGIHEWAARLPVLLLGVLGVVFTYRLALLVAGAQVALMAATILATSPIHFCLSSYLVLDMGVASLVTVGLYYFVRALPGVAPLSEPERRRSFLVSAAVFGLSVLVKGPIGPVLGAMALLPALATRPFRPAILSIPWGRMIAVFLLVAAPWFLLICRRHPEFFEFFFIHEHFHRYLKSDHGRGGPPWYFIPVLIAGALPWSCFLPAGLRSGRFREGVGTLLWSWLVLPVVFFSLSMSKLPSYILPVFPALAILVAREFARFVPAPGDAVEDGTGNPSCPAWAPASFRDHLWLASGCLLVGAFALVVVALAFLISPVEYPDLMRIRTHMVGLLLTIGAAALVMSGVILSRRARAAFRGLAVLSASALWAMSAGSRLYEPEKEIHTIAMELLRHRAPGEPVVCYGPLEYVSGLPFYLRDRVVIAGLHFGELAMAHDAPAPDEVGQFADAATARRWMAADQPRRWFVTDKLLFDGELGPLGLAKYPLKRQGDVVLFTNRPLGSTTAPAPAPRR